MVDATYIRSVAKEAADLALRLAALSADGNRHDMQALEEIEQLAARIAREAATARASAPRPVGESRGMWRIVQPARP